MNKKTLALWVVAALAVGGAMYEPGTARPAVEGAKPPVIIQSFASKELRPGDVWKVYLKASVPEGKMKYIFATISQPGANRYPTSIIRIKGENQKEISGYIYLNTAPAVQSNFFNLSLNLAVSVKGTGGFSQAVAFPLTFEAKPSPEEPPEGVFKEQDLGPISITLQSVSPGGGGQNN